MTESMARNYIESNNPKYRHWIRVGETEWNISYSDMERLQKDMNIRLEIPVISCDGKQFYSISEAAEYFDCSDERIRQKLKSDKHTEYFYLFTEK